jgi:ribosome biogenesis ATPase
VLCAKLRLAGDFDFPGLAKQTPGYVGADLAALTGAAGVIAVKRIFQEMAEGKLALPPTVRTEPVGQMPVDVQLEVLSTQTDPGTTLPSFLPPNSIAHFLLAHPTPLTEEQLKSSLSPSKSPTRTSSPLCPRCSHPRNEKVSRRSPM